MADEKTTEPTAAEKLAATLGGQEGEPAEGTTEAAGSAADGSEGSGEGKGTGQGKAAEPEGKPEKLTKPDGTPFTAADLTALNTALKAARKDARDAQGQLAEHRAKTGDRTVDDIERDAAATAEAVWKGRLVAASARAELRAAGLALPEGREAEAVARAVRLLDVDALTVDDSGAVGGLAEQIATLRVDFPSLFDQPRQARTTARTVNGADRQTSGNGPKSAAEQLAALLAG